MNLKDRIAVVTGGTKGIGKAVAEYLLKAGATVFICGRDKSALNRTIRDLERFGRVFGEVVDVRSETQVKMMLSECLRLFGRIDILINNAGVGIFGKTVEEIEPDDFRLVLETNLLGVYYACHYAIPLMKDKGGGYIINISSLAGQNAHPGMAAYNASKFGLNGFSEALMQEVRHDNIKVSYVCPGSVNTEFGDDEVSEEKAWQLQPNDIAQTILDLLSHQNRSLPSKVEIRPSKPPVK
jgi:NAD(P)-dependent dehydrogenase (short-subunit alcohol dehydrogenase family)